MDEKKPKGLVKWLSRNGEKIAVVLLVIWCMLPIVMVVYDVVTGLQGGFPSMEDDKLHSRRFYYPKAVRFYFTLFRGVGIATIAYALVSIVRAADRILDARGVKGHPWMYFLAAMLAWAVLCSNLADDPLLAFFGEPYLNDGLFSYFVYASVFICAATIRNERSRLLVVRLYCAVVVVLSTIVIAQEVGHVQELDLFFPSGRAAVFNQFNHFGYVLCMAVVAFLGLFLNDKGASKALRIAYLVGFAYVSFTLLINDTFGAYLAAFGGSVFAYVMFLLRTKRDRKPTPLDFAPVMLVAVVLIVAAASLAFSKDGMGIAIRNIQKNVMGFATDIHNVAENNEDAAKAGSTRMTLWKDTAQRITERPVFGFGPMGLYNNEHSITNGDAPHNEFLQIAAYLGIPGLLMYLCGVFSLAWRQLKNLHRLSPMVVVTVGVTATYLMSSAFGNPVFNSAPYFWLFFGLSTAMNEEEPSLLCPLSVDEKAAQEDDSQEAAA